MRRILYVDGFSFYYGVTDHWKSVPDPSDSKKTLAGLGWCDFRALSEQCFNDGRSLVVKYFTAVVTQNVQLPRHRPGEHARYATWMRALRTTKDLVVVEGFYRPADQENPDAPLRARSEKQTDANLAVEMILDAFAPPQSRPQHVVVISADNDLMPAIFALQERVPAPPRLTVLLPSGADKGKWEATYQETRRRLLACHAIGRRSSAPAKPVEVEVLTEKRLASSLLGYSLHDSHGSFECPEYWRLSEAYLNRK